MYTAEQIAKGLWDSHRRASLSHVETLDAEVRQRWERWNGTPDKFRREWEELDSYQKDEGSQWRDMSYDDGTLVIDGEDVPFEHIDNDDEEGMSIVKSTIKVGDQYFVKEGHHISHDGTYWDGDFYESVPRQVTSTVWGRK